MERQAKDGTIFRQIGPDDWQPITRQAKDGTIFKKVGSDDWAPLESTNQAPQERSFLGGVARGAYDNLPALGSLAGGTLGGILGAPTGPGALGTAAIGAGAGGYLGQATKNLLKPYVEDAPVTREELYLDPVKEGLMGALSEGIGSGIGKLGEEVAPILKNKGKQLVGELGNFSKKAVDVFVDRGNEINKIINQYGDELGEAIPDLKTSTLKKVRKVVSETNRDIDKYLKGEVGERPTNPKPTLDYLEESIKSLNTKTQTKDIKDLKHAKDVLTSMMREDGSVAAKDMHAYKRYLQKFAKYEKDGQLIEAGEAAEGIAKRGAATTRETFNEAVPEVADLNNKLFQIYQIDDVVPRSVFSKKSGGNAISSIASGKMPGQAKEIEKLGGLIDEPLLRQMENIYAAQKFYNPNSLSGYLTGKSTFASGLGTLYGLSKDGDASSAGTFGLLGAAAGSPFLLKQALRMARSYPQLGEQGLGLIGRTASQGLISPLAKKASEYVSKKKKK